MQLLGVFTSSFARAYVPIFLSQGLCQGIGNGFILCPTMSLLSTYFAKKRVVAIALAASGSATGGVVFPIIAQQLLPRLGFGWTVRVMGFVMVANVAIILSLGRTRIPGRKSGPWLELGAFKEAPYTLFICGMFCVFLALYFAFSYVSTCLNIVDETHTADMVVGQPICQGYFADIDRDKSHHSLVAERTGRPGPSVASSPFGLLPWADEHLDTICIMPSNSVLRMDCYHLTTCSVHIHNHIWIR
jgi:MFS family permease